MTTKRNIIGILFAVAIGLAAASPSFAAPKASSGSKGGGKGGGATGSFSLVMVTDQNGNGLPNWGDGITFDVSTTASLPYVEVSCYQGGVKVYTQRAGFYAGYAWTRTYTLQGFYWTGGAADCNAVLTSWNSSGTSSTTLATMSFPAYA